MMWCPHPVRVCCRCLMFIRQLFGCVYLVNCAPEGGQTSATKMNCLATWDQLLSRLPDISDMVHHKTSFYLRPLDLHSLHITILL